MVFASEFHCSERRVPSGSLPTSVSLSPMTTWFTDFREMNDLLSVSIVTVLWVNVKCEIKLYNTVATNTKLPVELVSPV